MFLPEYRAFGPGLLHDPTFRGLEADERLVFYSLRLLLHPSGIDYLDAPIDSLIDATGLRPPANIDGLLDDLRDAGLVRCDGHGVLWVVGALSDDPLASLADPAHRRALVRHLATLPRRSPVVAAFAERYRLDLPWAAADDRSVRDSAKRHGAHPPPDRCTARVVTPEPRIVTAGSRKG